jgi:hypothetical protein
MKIGVLFDDFMKSDKNYHIMKTLNDQVKESNNEVCGFLVNVSGKVIDTTFAYSNITDISHFNDGLLVATSIQTADCLRKAAVGSDKIYYIWKMEWMGHPFRFYEVYDILSSSNLQIVVRSDLQKKVLQSNFNLSHIEVIDDFNMEKLYEICKRE